MYKCGFQAHLNLLIKGKQSPNYFSSISLRFQNHLVYSGLSFGEHLIKSTVCDHCSCWRSHWPSGKQERGWIYNLPSRSLWFTDPFPLHMSDLGYHQDLTHFFNSLTAEGHQWPSAARGYYLKLHFSSFDPAWEVQGTAVLAGHLKVTFMFCSFLPGNQLLPKPYSRKPKQVIRG